MNTANNTKIIMDCSEQKFDSSDCCAKESIKEKLQENEIERSAAQPGYEHLYWVTNFGNVFSKLTNEKLTIQTNKQGYYFVKLSNENNKLKSVGIAILVYKTWKNGKAPTYDPESGLRPGPKALSHYVICKDGNKLNNHISNLECVPKGEVTKNGLKNSTTVLGYGIRILMFEKTDEKCTKVVKTFENMHKVCKYLCVRRTLRLSGRRPDGVERKIESRGNINNCMNGKKPTAYGYRWRWESPPPKETVEDIDDFECLGIIEGKDFKKYEINREGIGASLRAGGLIVINKNANNEIIKAKINKRGYLYVNLSSKGKRQNFRIHRLIGRYFLDEGESFYDGGFVINHIDENKLNNSVSTPSGLRPDGLTVLWTDNLEWTTPQKNSLHSLARRVAKLDKDTDEILDIYESIKEAYEDLNKKYNGGISNVCRGRQKTSAGFKWKYL